MSLYKSTSKSARNKKEGRASTNYNDQATAWLEFTERMKRLGEVPAGGLPQRAPVRGVAAGHPQGSPDSPQGWPPLSTAHISPQIEYTVGASLLKVSRGGVSTQVGGGKRQNIKQFSKQSRQRLMRTIARIRRDADLPMFVTLTYPNDYPHPAKSKVHLDMFFKRFHRRYPKAGGIWKLEPQERGAPHYHLLIWGVEYLELLTWVPQAWFEIAGNGDQLHLRWHKGQLGNGNLPCVAKVKSFKGVWAYAAKYLGKTFEAAGWGKMWTGRFWGVIGRENIPFGEAIVQAIEYKQATRMMRYQRRFAKLRRPTVGRSLTIFCDADQWIEKLIPDNS